jgi:hypothetical protein
MRIRILLFSSLTFKMPTKNQIFLKVFYIVFFEGTITSFFKNEKSKRSFYWALGGDNVNIFCEFCYNIIQGPAVRGLGVTDPCKALNLKFCDNGPLILVLFARPRVTRAAENEQQVSKLKNRFNKRFVIKYVNKT